VWSWDTTLSSAAELLSGVIQGNDIDPVAFVIFIDTLAKLLGAHNIVPKIFADDVKVCTCLCLM